MSGQRPFADRWMASFMTGLVAVCLLVGPATETARALDAGDGTVIAPQPGRRPLSYETGKITRLDGSFNRRFADKLELSAYQVHPMHFGTLRLGSGTVVLGTAGEILDDPDLLVFGGLPSAAMIELTGDPNVNVSIEIIAGLNAGFQLDAFQTSLGTPPFGGTPLDETGHLTFEVGARLSLDAGHILPGSDQHIGYTVSAYYE
jgi:hypothetical protein